MNNDLLFEKISEMNCWNGPISSGAERASYLEKLTSLLKQHDFVHLSGIKYGGKTTLLMQYINGQHKNLSIPFANFLYLDLSRISIQTYITPDFLKRSLELYIEHHNPQGQIYFFIDGVQAIENWIEFDAILSKLHEQYPIKVVTTSSARFALSKEYHTMEVSPLDFIESLQFKQILPASQSKPVLLHHLREYMQYGGFPEVVLEKNVKHKKTILNQYLLTIIEQELVLTNHIKNVLDVKRLVAYLLKNTAQTVSTYQIEKHLGISNENAGRYFTYLEENYLVDYVGTHTLDRIDQRSPKKVFCADFGLSSILGIHLPHHESQLLEMLVYQKLKKTYSRVWYQKEEEGTCFLAGDEKKQDIFNVRWSIDSNCEIKNKTIYWENNSGLQSPLLMSIVDFML